MTAPLSPEREAEPLLPTEEAVIRRRIAHGAFLGYAADVALLSALDHARSQLAAEREAGRQEGRCDAATIVARTILALLPAEVENGK